MVAGAGAEWASALMLLDLDAEAPWSAPMTPAAAAAFWRTDSLVRDRDA